ncbi:O-succinylbenzoate synthase [Lunatimonas lonarensis]|uniref:O-succinylbenzoate synthase n=1 Tax=Lunatimonas lonarensis TaxID=1232681 RepID=R7ZR53_9BACT|nr:o-succinylbenzoate synthase [Lunatimonas lonarensis]EON76499.1 O-succinylbenzoate synthase [Lunatimonas lonarensis]
MNRKVRVSAEIVPLPLRFKFDAGTSRGVLREKHNYLLKLRSPDFPGVFGIGEAGPLVGLSLDDRPDFFASMQHIAKTVEQCSFSTDRKALMDEIAALVPLELPSVRFALETAFLDLVNGGIRRIFPNSFFDDQAPIPINGLVWMGKADFMERQIKEKIDAGFRCIKMKIGAIDFDTEWELLYQIRKRYGKNEITLRVDANGAFTPADALAKLERLKELNIHSIEQPIQAGQYDEMAALCRHSPVPIALDEELIGIPRESEMRSILSHLKPTYIILKPTLLGGLGATAKWISIAEGLGIGWWMTSALESNVGLNAIAQFAATYSPDLPQGLGTGQLYHNNIESPLTVRDGYLWYDARRPWGAME